MKKIVMIVSVSALSLTAARLQDRVPLVHDVELTHQVPEDIMRAARDIMHDQSAFEAFIEAQRTSLDEEQIKVLRLSFSEEQKKEVERKEVALDLPRETESTKPVIANEQLKSPLDFLKEQLEKRFDRKFLTREEFLNFHLRNLVELLETLELLPEFSILHESMTNRDPSVPGFYRVEKFPATAFVKKKVKLKVDDIRQKVDSVRQHIDTFIEKNKEALIYLGNAIEKDVKKIADFTDLGGEYITRSVIDPLFEAGRAIQQESQELFELLMKAKAPEALRSLREINELINFVLSPLYWYEAIQGRFPIDWERSLDGASTLLWYSAEHDPEGDFISSLADTRVALLRDPNSAKDIRYSVETNKEKYAYLINRIARVLTEQAEKNNGEVNKKYNNLVPFVEILMKQKGKDAVRDLLTSEALEGLERTENTLANSSPWKEPLKVFIAAVNTAKG